LKEAHWGIALGSGVIAIAAVINRTGRSCSPEQDRPVGQAIGCWIGRDRQLKLKALCRSSSAKSQREFELLGVEKKAEEMEKEPRQKTGRPIHWRLGNHTLRQ
jgi:hypothetical protein